MLVHAYARSRSESGRSQALPVVLSALLINSLQFGTLQFGKFEEIYAIGYREGTKMLEDWKAAGKLPTGFEEGFEGVDEKKKKGRSLRRNSI